MIFKINFKILILYFILNIIIGSIFFGEEVLIKEMNQDTDSDYYFATVNFLKTENQSYITNKQDEVFKTRLLTPLITFLLTYFLSNNVAFGIINIIFIFLTGIIFWYFVYDFIKSKKIANLSLILFICSQPIIIYASRAMIFGPTYFFFILLIYFSLKFNFNSLKHYIYLIFILSLSFLNKETTFFALTIFFILVLFNPRYDLISKIKYWIYLFLSILISLIPSLLWQNLVNSSWINTRGKYFRLFFFGIYLNIINFLYVILSRFLISYNFLLIFFLKELYDLFKNKNWYFLKEIIIYSIPFGLLIIGTYFFAPPFIVRHCFFSFYIIIPLAAKQICKFSKINQIIILVIYFIISIILSFLFSERYLFLDNNWNLFLIAKNNFNYYFN